MDYLTFVSGQEPVNHYLRVLWLDANGKWGEAHDLADSGSDADSAWLHAYLHRAEGDEWNAKYWYNRAERPFPDCSLRDEWQILYEYFAD